MGIYSPRSFPNLEYPEGPAWLAAGADAIGQIFGGIGQMQEEKRQQELQERRMLLAEAQGGYDAAAEARAVEEHATWVEEKKRDAERWAELNYKEPLPGAMPSGEGLFGLSTQQRSDLLPFQQAERDTEVEDRNYALKKMLTEAQIADMGRDPGDGDGGVGSSFGKMMGEFVMADRALQLATEGGGDTGRAQSERDGLLAMIEMNIPDYREFESRFDAVQGAATKAEADAMIQALIYEPRMSPEGKQYVQGVLEPIAAMKPDEAIDGGGGGEDISMYVPPSYGGGTPFAAAGRGVGRGLDALLNAMVVTPDERRKYNEEALRKMAGGY